MEYVLSITPADNIVILGKVREYEFTASVLSLIHEDIFLTINWDTLEN